MKLYFAPMEGITGYIYRNAFHEFYGKGVIDKYFCPFISPNKTTGFRQREIQDIALEHNRDIPVVPQILTNNADDFCRTVELLSQYGYEEMNLNLGCPSGTVVSKNKGAGFLSVPDQLQEFFEQVFARIPDHVKISVKTRLGKEDPAEFEPLLEMFGWYPIHELIIHPRVQKDYYKNVPDLDTYGQALKGTELPVCYNGDLYRIDNCKKIVEQYPGTQALMLGRGLIADPELAEVVHRFLNGETDLTRESKVDQQAAKEKLKAFHDRIYEDYREVMSGDVNTIHKMKEMWFYMKHIFADSEKQAKKIKKAQRAADYEAAVQELFYSCDLMENPVSHF